MVDFETEERFIALETKVAFQERLVEELNGIVVQQSRLLDELGERTKKLEQSLREALFEKPGHERPPHY